MHGHPAAGAQRAVAALAGRALIQPHPGPQTPVHPTQLQQFDGLFTGLDVSRAEAEQMILQARLAVGWITEDELVAEEEEAVEADGDVEAGGDEA